MSSFPTSKYARYKRATAFFLDWLLRARGRGRHISKRIQLDAFNDVVKEIASKSTTLTPTLLKELPKALNACQCSITFREHVALFFPEDDEAQASHRHFLELLKSWYNTLKEVLEDQETDIISERTRFENYYDVLEVDEDYFPDEETFLVKKDVPKRTKAERRRVLDQAFEDDLRLQLSCFFLELEELVEEVFSVYDQVKKQQRTMVEATVVVKLAMDLAAGMTARLQAQYPAIQTAEDLLFLFVDRSSKTFKDQIAKAATDVQEKFQKDGTYTFVPGMLLSDFINVWWTLATFEVVVAKKADNNKKWNLIHLPDGYFGESYGEERTPHYVLPNSNNVVVFLMQQLPMMYNVVLQQTNDTDAEHDNHELVGKFFKLFREYFVSHKVTIPLVFTCVCWVKSVAALQGDGDLSRNISLMYMHSRNLMQRMENVLPYPTQMHDLIEGQIKIIKESTLGHAVSRMNPLLAGSIMLTHHFGYEVISSAVFLDSTKLRSFGHLYNALVIEGFLTRIPFLEELFDIYEDVIFTPSRGSAVHGSYGRVYLLSNHYALSAIDQVYQGVDPTRDGRIKSEKDFTDKLSKTHELMIDNDMTFLKGASPKNMLKTAADICSKDLFKIRVLSRDLLTLNDDLAGAFSIMCDELDQRQFCDEYIAGLKSGDICEDRRTKGLVTAVMFPLLPFLDALQPDGSMDRSALPVGMLQHKRYAVDGDAVRSMCMKVSAVINATFATTPLVCEHKYFLFPPRPNFIDQEYGTASFKTTRWNENREQIFSELMKLLKSSNVPLSGSDLSHLKSEIKNDPELLAMFSRPKEIGTLTDNGDLCTLLHQAAAGPAHDVNLVEWMIQMGGLINQPLHCRKEPRHRDLKGSRDTLPNTMAVHSAVIAGHEAIARMILEADNLVDLNTPTFHTKETIAHLAVKRGHRQLFHLIRCFGANVYTKDGMGNLVSDLLDNQRWYRESAEIASTAELNSEEPVESREHERHHDSSFRHKTTLRAERLRKLVFAPRDEDQRFISERKSKAKGKKGKKITSTTSVVETDSAEALIFMKTQRVPTDSRKNKDQPSGRNTMVNASLKNTAATFARLRDPSIPAAEKYEDVQIACKVVERLEELINLLSDPNRQKYSDLQLRIDVSFEAYRVIHMMQKFHRVDHAAIAVPALAPVRELCETTLDFTRLVLGTAELCVSVDRKTQAREILDVLEKRLLKTTIDKQQPSEFRAMVERYTTTRNAINLGRASSPDALRNLTA